MGHFLNVSVILETTRLAFAGEMPFPQVVAELSRIGVERYLADLVRLEKTHYSACGDSVRSPLPLAEAPEVARAWSAEQVVAAIRASQERQIAYPEFLRRVMAAGCAAYWVYLEGRKAIYLSRDGSFHVESMPPRQ